MSLKIGWSAFIYTRTYKFDYRIIAVPDDFTEEKTKWVISHIKEVKTAIAVQSLSPPVELLQRVFLSDHQHYVFGVLCNLRKLLTENERKDLAEKYLSQEAEKAKDLMDYQTGNARLIAFTFLGYVIKRTSDISELPPISFDLDIFKPLCQYIYPKWLEESKSPPTLVSYTAEESLEWLLDPHPKIDTLPILNTDPRKLALQPNTEAYIQQLWTAAAICKKPQSIWIGQLPGNPKPESILINSIPEKSILESRFFNIALPNIDSLKIYSKQSDEPLQPLEGSNLLDSISSFLAGEMGKIPNVFSHKSDDYETKLRALQENFEEFKRKHDKEIAELYSLYSELKELQNKREEL